MHARKVKKACDNESLKIEATPCRGNGRTAPEGDHETEKVVNGRVQAPSRHLAGDDIRLQYAVVGPEGKKDKT